MLKQIQGFSIRALRPLARFARKILTPPPEPPPAFHWHTINAGTASGASVLLPSETELTQAIVAGKYESRTFQFVESLVSPEDVCFDIGGHYGAYTLSLAKLACDSKVHTFEPVPAHADRIRQAAKKSGFENVTVHQVAMAGDSGKMKLHFANEKGDDSMAYLEAYGGVDTEAAQEHYAAFSTMTVSTTTLDHWMDASPEPVDLPRFIKIDAEGAEVAILRSGMRLITQARPRLLIEVHGIQEAMGCADLLRRIDYQAILLTKQKVTMPLLWVAQSDQEAISQVRRVLGEEPTVLFGPSR